MSYSINLSINDLKIVDQEMKKQRDAKIYKRLIALKMKHQGLTNQNISNILNISLDTVTDWFRIYCLSGINSICQLHLKGRKVSKLDKYIDELRQFVTEQTISTISELQNYISNKYGFEIEHSWLSRYCKKNSIVLIKKQG